jgi:sec-independent protein translocase protein TatA
MIPRIGPTELIIILFIVLIIFGVGRLTDIGGALGKSIREFRKATVEDESTNVATTDSNDQTGQKPSSG